MKNRKTVGFALLVALAAVGCAEIGDDPYDPALDEEEAAARLPEPALWRVPRPALSSEQRGRQFEVDRYIRDNLYRGYRIVDTTQTYSGDIVDWVDPDSVPGSQIEPPPPVPAEELRTPPGVELQPTELEEYPELGGPDGTIPVTRPDFAAYVRGESTDASLADYVRNRQAGGQPWYQNRQYGGFTKSSPNTLVVANVANNIGSVENGNFSLIEVATECDGWNTDTTMELVGAVVTRDRVSSDGALRLRVEFFTAGGGAMGNYVGGWDGQVKGFVPAAGRPYGPNVLLPQSVIGSTPQYESPIKIQNYNGNWWIAHNGNWLGYYPGSYFDLMHYQGCKSLWYGEVYDPTPTSWTFTDMGSGYWPLYGNKWAAHVRNPYYGYGSSTYWPDGASKMVPQDSLCYSNTAMTWGASPWDRYFFLGGPGGDAFGCD